MCYTSSLVYSLMTFVCLANRDKLPARIEFLESFEFCLAICAYMWVIIIYTVIQVRCLSHRPHNPTDRIGHREDSEYALCGAWQAHVA